MILLGVIVALPARATPFQGSEIYQTNDRRGGFIVLSGQPNTVAEVSGTDTIKTDTLRRADNCGVGRVRIPEANPAPKLSIDGKGEINYTSLPTISGYRCSDSNFLYGNAYDPTTRTVYVTGFEPEQEFISRIRREETRRVNLNNCGFGLVPMKYGDGDLFFKGQQYRYSQLPLTVRPPVCRQINGTYKTYFAIPLGQ